MTHGRWQKRRAKRFGGAERDHRPTSIRVPGPPEDADDPLRRMPDGSPCWCVSTEAPHEGWVHAPFCEARRADIDAE